MSYYYTRDHEGSVRELCSSSGTILTRYTYDPYGKTTVNHLSGSIDAVDQYAGLYAHAPSGLYLPVLRGGYDPNTGRFISRDIAEERGGLNLYEYADDDPVDEIDPLGLAGKNCVIEVLVAHYRSGGKKKADEALNKPPTCQYSLGIVGCGANQLNGKLRGHGSGIPGMPKNNSGGYPNPETERLGPKYNLDPNDFTDSDALDGQALQALLAARKQATSKCATDCCDTVTIRVLIAPSLREFVSTTTQHEETIQCPKK